MTNATVKLYASLGDYLPPGAKNNAIEIELPPEEATVTAALSRLNVPMERCHLVLVNGLFIPPSSRANCPVEEGDTIAAWPPVAGG
jgi:sulfur carrier protein ThiS